MQREVRKLVPLITPLLLHQTVMLAAALLLRMYAAQYSLAYDAALAVLAGNLLVIPAAAWMYVKDSREISASGSDVKDSREIPVSGPDVKDGREIPASGKENFLTTWQPEPGQADDDEKSSRFDKKKRSQDDAGSGVRFPALFGLFCFLAGGALNIAWSGALNLLRVQELFPNQVQEQLFSGSLTAQIVGLGLAAPLAEELIFRGLIYRRMRRLFSLRAAVVLSSLLFAAYHGNVVQILFAFPLAVVLALIYERGKLFAFPVLFHAGSNLTAILLQIF